MAISPGPLVENDLVVMAIRIPAGIGVVIPIGVGSLIERVIASLMGMMVVSQAGAGVVNPVATVCCPLLPADIQISNPDNPPHQQK